MKNKIINIVLVVLICTFIYSGYHVVMWLKSDKETKDLETGLYREVVTEQNDDNNNIQATTVIDFEKLKEINQDVVAWIKIDNTYINYPILQGETDEYYLRKDIYKRYNYSGSIFIYSDANSQFLDENTVIYGHNMKNDRMFTSLYKINRGNYGKDIDINIFTENEAKKYKVFSSYIDKPDIEIIQNKFTDNEKQNYIDTAIKKSNIKYNQEINYQNKIITLITCGSTNQERVIVHAIECK